MGSRDIVLAIETSCDDTSAAVMEGNRLLSMTVSRQRIHKLWGGVVPILARRAHEERLGPAIDLALKEAGMGPGDIDAIAVTQGPGLAISLEAGIRKARELAERLGITAYGINHLEGHFYSVAIADREGRHFSNFTGFSFPCLGLLISGGHTELFVAEGHGEYSMLGRTRDDSIGEAFDKIGRELGIGYPAGPEIDRLAQSGNPVYDLPVPMKGKGYGFSYSGLKTKAISVIREMRERLSGEEWERFVADFAASLQRTIAESVRIKVEMAWQEFRPEMTVVAGGVSANSAIREALKGFNAVFPARRFCTDNAAMIGAAFHYLRDRISEVGERKPRWRLGERSG